MKRSQLYSQIFIYILTIVLISFILIYGYNAIYDFKKRAEQISCLKLKNDLQNAVESILSDFGRVEKKDIKLCNDYTQICFVETFERPTVQSNVDPIIKDSVLSNAKKNVFLLKDIVKESFYIGPISVNPDVFCINAVDNRVSLRLEGKGNHIILSQWT